MQARYSKPKNVSNYTHSAAVTAGQVIVVNSSHLLIAAADFAANALGAYHNEGEFEFAKDNSNITTAFTAVYWDVDGSPVGGVALSGALTTTSSGNIFIGYAIETAGAGVGSVHAILIKPPATITMQGAVGAAITDPGNAGAIPVTGNGYVPIVTAGSETRTLAAPTFVGQELVLYIKTDGGTCVITVASAINQTGNNTITMADVRDYIRLQAIESGSNKVWAVVANDGAALSTV